MTVKASAANNNFILFQNDIEWYNTINDSQNLD